MLQLMTALAALAAAGRRATVSVDARADGTPFVHRWKRAFGSGHASLTLTQEWRQQFARAVTDLGLAGVRYHGMFDDDMGPVVGGDRHYNFSAITSTWDLLVAARVTPVVELSFMPAYIAGCSWHGHCAQTPLNCTGYWCMQCNGKGVGPVVNPTAPPCRELEFHYQGIKQPPAPGVGGSPDYRPWYDLVRAVAQHAVSRYGIKTVRSVHASRPCVVTAAW